MGETHKSYPSLPKGRPTYFFPLLCCCTPSTSETDHQHCLQVLHVPDDLFPVVSTAAQAVYTKFIDKLATFLDASIVTQNISVYWAANETVSTTERGENIYDYLHLVGFDLEWSVLHPSAPPEHL